MHGFTLVSSCSIIVRKKEETHRKYFQDTFAVFLNKAVLSIIQQIREVVSFSTQEELDKKETETGTSENARHRIYLERVDNCQGHARKRAVLFCVSIQFGLRIISAGVLGTSVMRILVGATWDGFIL